jgi:hypothetical protein
VATGVTPFEKDFPGGYFHKTRTSMGARLEHPVVARISLSGYASKEVKLTEGPMNWISLNGRNRGEYWLFKSDHFHVDLLPISATFTGEVAAKVSDAEASLQPELSLEDLVRQAKPAVVYLRGLEKAGSGFFVTGTGIIVTNAHLARGEETLIAILSSGQQLEAKVVHIDQDLDIALAKVEGASGKFDFPHLTLKDATGVHQGENVLAIGNPGDAMLFSVTKGIVSAVGKFPEAGPGTWIQTDTHQSGQQWRSAVERARRSHRHQHAKANQEECHGDRLRSQRDGSSRGSSPLLSQPGTSEPRRYPGSEVGSTN